MGGLFRKTPQISVSYAPKAQRPMTRQNKVMLIVLIARGQKPKLHQLNPFTGTGVNPNREQPSLPPFAVAGHALCITHLQPLSRG